MAVRCFAAILLADEVRAAVASEVDRLRPLSRGVAWVPADNLHVTLRFLGQQDEARVASAVEALEEAASGAAPFALTLSGLGGFPSLDRPRILWVGAVAGGAEAHRLQQRVEDALDRRHFGREPRPWHLHVTVGRVFDDRRWRREGGAEIASAVAGLAGRPFGSFSVGSVSLLRSQLGPAGARYSPLAVVPLSG